MRDLLARVGRGQLEVDVLERGARDRELAERLAARERGAGELMQQRGRILGLALLGGAVLVEPCDAVARRSADAELARRPFGEDAAVLDDRDAIGERLGL